MKTIQRIIAFLVASQFAVAQSNPTIPMELQPIYSNLKQINTQNKNFETAWLELRNYYSKDNQTLIDAWILSNKNGVEKTPSVQANLIRQPDGSKALRATFDFKNQSSSYELSPSLVDDQILINKKSIHDMQLNSVNAFVQSLAQKQVFDQVKLSQTVQSLDSLTLASMNAKDRATYYLHQRLLLELAQKVLAKNKKVSAVQMQNMFALLFADAQAAAGSLKKCFNQLGYIVSLDSSGQCPNDVAASSQFAQIKCENDGQLCNPHYYGLNRSNANSGLCLTKADLAAQKTCAQLSPLTSAEDVKKLMASLMRIKPESSPSGEKAPPQRPDEFIQQALAACEDSGLKASTSCTELMSRKVAMNSFMVDRKASDNGGERSPRNGEGPGRQAGRASSVSGFSDSEASSFTPSTHNTNTNACSVFCTVGNWLTSNTAIMSYLTLGGIAAGYLIAKKKYKNSSATTTASSTSSTTTSTVGTTTIYGAPTVPTTADYTGGVR